MDEEFQDGYENSPLESEDADLDEIDESDEDSEDGEQQEEVLSGAEPEVSDDIDYVAPEWTPQVGMSDAEREALRTHFDDDSAQVIEQIIANVTARTLQGHVASSGRFAAVAQSAPRYYQRHSATIQQAAASLPMEMQNTPMGTAIATLMPLIGLISQKGAGALPEAARWLYEQTRSAESAVSTARPITQRPAAPARPAVGAGAARGSSSAASRVSPGTSLLMSMGMSQKEASDWVRSMK